MKILIVTTRFFPYGSATSAVVGNLAKALLEKECEVTVLALSRFKGKRKYEWDNIPVVQEYVPSMITKEEIKSEITKHPARAINGLMQKLLDKIIQKVNVSYHSYSIEYSKTKKYEKAIIQEIKNNYDLCLATLMPIEAIWAANQINLGRTAFAIYQVDPYWNNADLPVNLQEKRWAFESQFVSNSLFCLTTPVIECLNVERDKRLADKYIAAEFPCLKNHNVSGLITEKQSEIHCVFLGTLNPEIRPPEKVIDIISLIHNPDVSFDFYGSGQSLIEQLQSYQESSENIHLFGSIPSLEAEKVRINADYLINIDNTSSVLVPSKIFEYFSTGKPIINFYFNEDSYTLTYFKKYPLCININLNMDPDKNAQILEKYITNTHGKTIAFDIVKQLYIHNTPEYVAEQCINAYKESATKR